MYELDEYLNQDIYNPKYLFHGSSSFLQTIEPRSHMIVKVRKMRIMPFF